MVSTLAMCIPYEESLHNVRWDKKNAFHEPSFNPQKGVQKKGLADFSVLCNYIFLHVLFSLDNKSSFENDDVKIIIFTSVVLIWWTF